MIKGNSKRNGYVGLGAMVVLAAATIFGSDPLYKTIDDMVRPVIYTPGTYAGSARGYGGKVQVKVTVTDKSIKEILVNGEKETLLDHVLPGLTDMIVSRQTTAVDAVSGATMSSQAIMKAVDQALALARGEEIEKEPQTEKPEDRTADAKEWKDGTYLYEAPEYDQNGFKDQVEMTIEGNVITALNWDSINQEGKKKSQLSMDGQYVMRENGPKWHEQSEAVVNFVLENQGLDGLLDEEGYTDAVSAVSINLSGFAYGVKDCLSQAANGRIEGTASPNLKDGTYLYEAPEYDQNGFKDMVELTVEGNTITALTWDSINQEGKKKSQLSMEGQYVMTENGPKWHEQSEAVVGYVLENQGLNGLLDEEGYTDAVSTVSINLSGFAMGVKDCLQQAAQ